jgi:hypothetical protein
MAAAMSDDSNRPSNTMHSVAKWKIAWCFALARSSTDSQFRWKALRSNFGQCHPSRGPDSATPPPEPRW